MTNKPHGVLYVGVTSDLLKRAWEHREGVVAGFTKRYGLKLLAYFEWHDEITLAIQREKNMKHWSRAWKIELIQSMNPDWNDLFETLGYQEDRATAPDRRVKPGDDDIFIRHSRPRT